ncbi:hypothetical protein [Streptomyces lavendulae]|uniref:hypothetical protein n=1 Tax=Streptomyces lavendulae TaxID=1914 RepID=UPI0024A26370|nr:hypothetical protein [Streptomyces lavendulae]GLW03856.1 hypothetical protein Slala05_74860 [Streptomyces lavendulae subsp. lavendulae]
MASDRYLDINNLADGRAATGGRRDEELFRVTVTGGEKELLDPILAERNSEYSEYERANLLDRKDNMFVVTYGDVASAQTAVDLFQAAGATVEVNAHRTRGF